MKFSKFVLTSILVALTGFSFAASGVLETAPVDEMEGVIEDLDFSANTMIFEGVRFHMAPDLTVEIRGSYGAFTMLEEGMKAVVTYRVVSGSERYAIHIQQLPDNVEVESV